MNFAHWRHYARGWVFHFLGKPEPAYEAFLAAIKAQPRDVQSARHLAAIAAGKERWEVAETWFVRVLDVTPDDADTWFNLGFVRDHARKPQEALQAFHEAVQRKPALDRAWYGMGLAHARLGQHTEAAAALEKAVELQPMNGEAFYQLGMAYHHANQPDEVTRVVGKLVGFEPKRAKRLVQDAQRADLMHLIPELPF